MTCYRIATRDGKDVDYVSAATLAQAHAAGNQIYKGRSYDIREATQIEQAALLRAHSYDIGGDDV